MTAEALSEITSNAMFDEPYKLVVIIGVIGTLTSLYARIIGRADNKTLEIFARMLIAGCVWAKASDVPLNVDAVKNLCSGCCILFGTTSMILVPTFIYHCYEYGDGCEESLFLRKVAAASVMLLALSIIGLIIQW